MRTPSLLEMVKTLYGYNRWAMDKIFAAADGLPVDVLDRPSGPGLRSMRDTLLHTLDTHQSWLSWWDGSRSAEEAMRIRLDPSRFPDVESIRIFWSDLDRQTWAFIDQLQESDIGRIYTSQPPGRPPLSLPLGSMMFHVANHGTQHRSELAALLSAEDRSPGDLDMLFYLLEGEQGQASTSLG